MKWFAVFVVAQVFLIVSCEESKDAAKAAEPAKKVEAAVEAKKDEMKVEAKKNEVSAEAKKDKMTAEAKAKFQNLVRDTKRAKRWGYSTRGYYERQTTGTRCSYTGCRCYRHYQCNSNYCRNNRCDYRSTDTSPYYEYTTRSYEYSTSSCRHYGCSCNYNSDCYSYYYCQNYRCRHRSTDTTPYYDYTPSPDYEYSTTRGYEYGTTSDYESTYPTTQYSCRYYGCSCNYNSDCNSYNCEYNYCRSRRTTDWMTSTWGPTRPTKRVISSEEWSDEEEETKKREEKQEKNEEREKIGKKKTQ